MSADFDFSELDRLAADLGTVPAKTGPKIRQALEVTSRHVKDAWRDKLKGSISFKHLPGAVSYDVTTFQGFGASVFKSEIGFDKDKPQGALGTFSEFGKPNQPPWVSVTHPCKRTRATLKRASTSQLLRH